MEHKMEHKIDILEEELDFLDKILDMLENKNATLENIPESKTEIEPEVIERMEEMIDILEIEERFENEEALQKEFKNCMRTGKPLPKIRSDIINKGFDEPSSIFEQTQFIHDESFGVSRWRDIFVFHISLLYDLYTSAIGIVLIVSVPQECGGNTCALFEDIFNGLTIYDATFFINIVSFFSFLCFYGFEYIRERDIKKYLKTSVEEEAISFQKYVLHKDHPFVKRIESSYEYFKRDPLLADKKYDFSDITDTIRSMVFRYNKIYLKWGLLTTLIVFLNTVFSIGVLLAYQNNQKMYLGLVTNVLIIFPKMYDIFNNAANTRRGHVFSAFQRERAYYKLLNGKTYCEIMKRISEMRNEYINKRTDNYLIKKYGN
jgi:hypothetical protein